MRICLVSGSRLADAFRRAGHEVVCPGPAAGVLPVERLLPAGYEPELLVQVESLGPRTLLEGLEHLRCPTVFWSASPSTKAGCTPMP